MIRLIAITVTSY